MCSTAATLDVAITTAGYNIEGPCYNKRREVIEMLNSTVPNDDLFGITYTIDEGGDWTQPASLEKANPNMGVSVYRDFLLSQQQRAINNARHAGTFKTKHLNVWVSCEESLQPGQFKALRRYHADVGKV